MTEQKTGLGYGVSGWKGRQERARTKMTHGKTREEKRAINAERKRLYAERHGDAAGLPADNQPDESAGDASRDALVQALIDAGEKKPGPNTKLETLKQRVAALDG